MQLQSNMINIKKSLLLVSHGSATTSKTSEALGYFLYHQPAITFLNPATPHFFFVLKRSSLHALDTFVIIYCVLATTVRSFMTKCRG